MICIYCGKPGRIKQRSVGKNKRREMIWICGNGCNAYTKCHIGTDIPLGFMANKRDRMLRAAAHQAFDPIWRQKGYDPMASQKRTAAYQWLAEKMGDTRTLVSLLFNGPRHADGSDQIQPRKTG